MFGHQTGEDAFLLHGGHVGFRHFVVAAVFNESGDGGVLCCRLFGQGVLGGHRHIAHTHQGVRASGVDFQRLTAFDLELQLNPFRAADPVALHGLDLFRPVFQLVQIRQQLFGVVSDLHEPLGNFLALHQGT